MCIEEIEMCIVPWNHKVAIMAVQIPRKDAEML